MPKRTVSVLIVCVLSLVTVPALAADTAFDQMTRHYEEIRQRLMSDSVDGVASNAAAIAELADRLARDFDAAAAGIEPKDAEACTTLLPEIASAAEDLEDADGLATAREAFSELTKPMVRLREMASGDRPLVAYCPMVEKAWLQPDEEIGNPYDSSMTRCGRVVSK